MKFNTKNSTNQKVIKESYYDIKQENRRAAGKLLVDRIKFLIQWKKEKEELDKQNKDKNKKK